LLAFLTQHAFRFAFARTHACNCVMVMFARRTCCTGTASVQPALVLMGIGYSWWAWVAGRFKARVPALISVPRRRRCHRLCPAHLPSALNKLEIPAAAALAYAYCCGATPGGVWPLLPVAAVTLETALLLPGLFARAAAVIAGRATPPSRLHALAALLSAVKLGSLLALGLALKG
jgi:hypothetical protein